MGIAPDNIELLVAENRAAWDRVRELIARLPVIRSREQSVSLHEAQMKADRTKFKLDMAKSRRRA